MQIRAARSEDIPAIVEMNKAGWFADYLDYIPEGFGERQVSIYGEPETIQRLIGEYNAYLVAEEAGQVIGAACASRLSDHEAELWWIHVNRGERGLGVGRQLVEAIIEHLPSNVQRLFVTTFDGYKPTIAFYESVGFVEFSKTAQTWHATGDERLGPSADADRSVGDHASEEPAECVQIPDVRLVMDLAGRRASLVQQSH